jgi:hypothetical protein
MKNAEETHHFFVVETLVRLIKTLNNMVLKTLAMRDHHFPATVKIVHVNKGGKGLRGGSDIPSGELTVWVTQILNLRLLQFGAVKNRVFYKLDTFIYD